MSAIKIAAVIVGSLPVLALLLYIMLEDILAFLFAAGATIAIAGGISLVIWGLTP